MNQPKEGWEEKEGEKISRIENVARNFCRNTPRIEKESGVAFYQRLLNSLEYLERETIIQTEQRVTRYITDFYSNYIKSLDSLPWENDVDNVAKDIKHHYNITE